MGCTNSMRSNTLAQAIAVALGLATITPGVAQTASFDVPEQDAISAISEFAHQANLQIVAPADQVRGIKTHSVHGSIDVRVALKRLLEGTGIIIASDDGHIISLRRLDVTDARGGSPTRESRTNVGVSPAADPTESDTPTESGTLEEVIVTAQKRTEDLQRVPISMEVLGGQRLEQLQVSSFDDYTKFLPSVSFQSTGPGQAKLYFRGIATGGVASHDGSLPTTGLYLDETPVTTIGQSVDLHVYDIQRVEALAGPQGTLYGASSLSGTLRIITNKPDPTAFAAGYDIKGDKFGKGGAGGEIESFVNVPLNDSAAIRLVGYYEHDGGYISNDFATRTYQRAVPSLGIPADPLTINNGRYAKRNFNDVDTYGGRAALKVDLNEQWSITPSVVYQHQESNGVFSFDPAVGDLQVTDFKQDTHEDDWYQLALTIEGKISDWNVLYAGGWFQRHVRAEYDYSEYSVAYDKIGYAVAYLQGNDGKPIDPTQYAVAVDEYTKQTQEVRISSPSDYRARLTLGAFYQRQTDAITSGGYVDNLASTNLIADPASNLTGIYSVDGQPGALAFARENRTDRDYALFADGTLDITEQLKLSAGVRGFVANNSLFGFFGYQSGFFGEGSCVTPIVYSSYRPCINVDKHVRDSGETHRVTLTYQIDPDVMTYATYSTGFRPGGINTVPYIRLPDGTTAPLPNFEPDTLTNMELGWKSTWFHDRLRANGAIFYEKWKGVQAPIVGPEGLTSIFNAGNAVSKGIEGDLSWNILENLNVSASGTYVDAKLSTNFCPFIVVNGIPIATSTCATADVLAPAGTRLPATPQFKADATARYKIPTGQYASYVQTSVLHQSGSRSYLEPAQDSQIGDVKGFTTVDFSAGTGLGNWHMELFIENAFDERGTIGRNVQCIVASCYASARSYPTKPQLFGIRFGQRF
jgi:outer membrane receptor protein involved in Fe transport